MILKLFRNVFAFYEAETDGEDNAWEIAGKSVVSFHLLLLVLYLERIIQQIQLFDNIWQFFDFSNEVKDVHVI